MKHLVKITILLSPLLWNHVIDSLLVRLNEANFYTIAYADDSMMKIELLLFTMKMKLVSIKVRRPLDTTLCFAQEIKYLGITLYAKLEFPLGKNYVVLR